MMASWSLVLLFKVFLKSSEKNLEITFLLPLFFGVAAAAAKFVECNVRVKTENFAAS